MASYWSSFTRTGLMPCAYSLKSPMSSAAACSCSGPALELTLLLISPIANIEITDLHQRYVGRGLYIRVSLGLQVQGLKHELDLIVEQGPGGDDGALAQQLV